MRAQVAMEFLTYSVIFLIATTIVISGIVLFGSDTLAVSQARLSNEMVSRVASSVGLVQSIGEGFEYTVRLDQTVNGKKYLIIFRENSVLLTLGGNVEDPTYSISIPSTTFKAQGNAVQSSEFGGIVVDPEIGDVTLYMNEFGQMEVLQ